MFPRFVMTLICHVLQLHAALSSFRALQSSNADTVKQWLTFWLLFTVFEVATSWLDLFAIYVIPFYDEVRVGFIFFLGACGGAGKLYPMVEPFFLKADVVAAKYEVLAEKMASKNFATARAKAEEMAKKAKGN